MTNARTPASSAAAPMTPGGIPRDDSSDDDIPRSARADASTRTAGNSGKHPLRWPSGLPRDPRDITPGTALFTNNTTVAVRFTMRDEGNRDVRYKCPPGDTVEVPLEYADLVPRRAPHLTELGRAARREPDPDDM